MKKNIYPITLVSTALGIAIAATSLLSVAPLSAAPGGGKGTNRLGPGNNGLGKPGLRGAARQQELHFGALHEEFVVWKIAVYGGKRFFGANQRSLQAEYGATYERIVKGLVSERLTEEQGRDFKAELVSIGEAAATSGDDATQTALAELNGKMRAAAEKAQVVPEELRTPTLNIKQEKLQCFLQWAEEDGEISSGRASSYLSDIKSNEEKEERYKAGGDLRDTERERLHEDLRDIAKDIVKAAS